MKSKIILLCLLIFSIENTYSLELQDSVFQTYFSNRKIKTIKSYAQSNGKLIPNGLFMEYYDNGHVKDSCWLKNGIRVGNRIIYSRTGFIKAKFEYNIDIFPRLVVATTYYKSGSCSMCKSEVVQVSASKQTDETRKYYWRNGSVMDSIVLNKSITLFRARFYEDGKIDFVEKYPENPQKGDTVIITGYNKDGSIKYSRTEVIKKGGTK